MSQKLKLHGAKVTARGMRKGNLVIITCIQEGGKVTLFRDGLELKDTDNDFRELLSYTQAQFHRAELSAPHSYNPEPGTIEAYWLALHETYFDELPEIEIEGEVDTFGSPYSNEDTGDAVF